MGAYTWAEFTCGFSMYGYRALDLYNRILSAGMTPPKEEAWYLLNTETAPVYRQWVRPKDWWQFSHLESYGQRPCLTEWYLEITGQVMTQQAARRIGRVLSHLSPAGETLPPGIAVPRIFRAAIGNPEHLQVAMALSERVARL